MATSGKNIFIIVFTLVLLLALVVPIAYFFWDAYSDTKEPFFMGLFIVLIVAYLLVAAMIIYVFGGKKENPNDDPGVQAGTGSSPSKILTAMTLGAALGGSSSKKKRKSISESARDELFWQEKYHKDRHYDDEEDL